MISTTLIVARSHLLIKKDIHFTSEERNAVDEQTKKKDKRKFDLAYKKTKIKKHDRLLTTQIRYVQQYNINLTR